MKPSRTLERLRWNRLKRFSLATLLLLTTVSAAALGIWKWASYEPITDRISTYEKAPSTLGDSIDVGPNRVSIKLLARNDRSGALHYENGRGVALKNVTAKDAAVLADAGPWLDVVQLELAPSPDRLDVIEVRIFDHGTHTMIAEGDPAFGWRLAAPDVVQIYGLGKRIPETLDVWLRLQSYAAKDAVQQLAPTPQAKCQLPEGTLTLEDIRAGQWSWLWNNVTNTGGFQQLIDVNDSISAAIRVEHADAGMRATKSPLCRAAVRRCTPRCRILWLSVTAASRVGRR